MNRFLLDKDNTALLIIDIQDRLANVMKTREEVVKNCLHLIELAKMLNIPVVLTEQYPKGLGPTVNEIKEQLPVYQ
ncbi:MAG: isochorismatase family protein, partial [Nitrospiraceae bacterium]|nr:isochorismatase family protein [Nitrospiraceae bacterium]